MGWCCQFARAIEWPWRLRHLQKIAFESPHIDCHWLLMSKRSVRKFLTKIFQWDSCHTSVRLIVIQIIIARLITVTPSNPNRCAVIDARIFAPPGKGVWLIVFLALRHRGPREPLVGRVIKLLARLSASLVYIPQSTNQKLDHIAMWKSSGIIRMYEKTCENHPFSSLNSR